MQRVRFDAGAPADDWEHVYIDTDNLGLSGTIELPGMKVELPGVFFANDRHVRYVSHPHIPPPRSGSIHCPAGTAFWTKILAVWINVAAFVCDG